MRNRYPMGRRVPNNILNMNKIIVTGAAGYIGSNAVVKLVEETNARVIAIDRREMQWSIPEKYKGKVKKYQLDIADPGLSQVFTSNKDQIRGVFHFAGDISVPESVEHPLQYYQNNFFGAMNLIEMCKRYDVNNFVFSSTAAVYGEPKFTKSKKTVNENDALVPINPYGESKLMVEQMLRACSVAYPKLKHCSLRYFNVAGNDPRQRVYDPYWKEKTNLFPALMRAYLGYTPDIRIFGNRYKTTDGTAIRDYIHVTDLIDAHIHAMSRMHSGAPVRPVYNVGNGNGYSVKEVIDSFERVVGPVPTVQAPRREGDPERLVSCPKLIKKDFNWKPKYTHIDDMVRTYARMVCNDPNSEGIWTEKVR